MITGWEFGIFSNNQLPLWEHNLAERVAPDFP